MSLGVWVNPFKSRKLYKDAEQEILSNPESRILYKKLISSQRVYLLHALLGFILGLYILLLVIPLIVKIF